MDIFSQDDKTASDQTNNKKDTQNKAIYSDLKRAIMGGGVTTAIILVGSLFINISSGSDARLLLESMMPSTRFLCSAVMTASSTILALMLTLLSMSGSSDTKFKERHYERVRQIAQGDAIVLMGAIILLLFLSIPFSDSVDVAVSWYTSLYYITLTSSAILGGSLIIIVLMLYSAITDLITVMHPDKNSQLTRS